MDTGPVRKTIAERGSLESANAAKVSSPIEGQTTIRLIVPEGTKVKEGELICELDVSALRDQLVNQEITTGQAKADLTQVRKTLEVAEMAVREYLEGTYPIKEQKLEDRLALAKSERARRRDPEARAGGERRRAYRHAGEGSTCNVPRTNFTRPSRSSRS